MFYVSEQLTTLNRAATVTSEGPQVWLGGGRPGGVMMMMINYDLPVQAI